MTTIATVLAVVVIALLSVVVFVSFAIYMKLIEKMADDDKKTGVPRMKTPPAPPINRMPIYQNPPAPPPCRADWSLPNRIREREQQKLNKL